MKRKHFGTILASAMMTSLFSPVAPICAKTVQELEVQPIVINNSWDFITNFAQYTVTYVDEFGQVITTTNYYTEVTYENYGVILWGKQYYDQLPIEVRMEIDAIILANTGIQYGYMVDCANGIATEIAAQEAARIQAEEEARIAAEQAAALEAQQAQMEMVGPMPEQMPQPEVEQPEAPVSEEVAPMPEEQPMEVQQPEQEEAVEETIQVEQLSLEEVLFNQPEMLDAPAMLVEEAISNDSVLMVAEPVAQQEIVEEKVEVITNTEASEVAQTTQQNAAQNFVNQYCTTNGSIIKAATSGNYQLILSGYGQWQNLTIVQKNEVNNILLQSGGQTYTALYNAAQIINGTPQSSPGGVHTSVSSNASLYSLLCMISALLFSFLFKRKEN